jgi:hypothetical protein
LTRGEKVEKQTKEWMDAGLDEASARQVAELMVATEEAVGSEVLRETTTVLRPAGSSWGAPSIKATTPTNPGSLSNRRKGRGPY